LIFIIYNEYDLKDLIKIR